ncbi:MAG: DUF805 domain-containing protein [Sulfitobacter sp.]
MSQQWHYVENGAARGPVPQEEFDALVAAGTIQPDTLVWHDGMSDWVALSTLAAPTAPPPPSQAAQYRATPAFEEMSPAGEAQRADASTFMGALKDGFGRYVDFGSRSNRPQYWYWFLWMLIIGFITGMLDGMLGTGGVVNGIWTLAALLPGIALSIRRLHDIGRSGWWLLIGLIPLVGAIVLLVFFCTRSENQTNRWGPVPR